MRERERKREREKERERESREREERKRKISFPFKNETLRKKNAVKLVKTVKKPIFSYIGHITHRKIPIVNFFFFLDKT
jgi:hypothetical protein